MRDGFVKEDIDFLYQKGIRLTPEAYDFLEKAQASQAALSELAESGQLFITREALEELLSRQEKIPVQIATVARAPDFRPAAAEFEASFRLIGRSDITGKSNCTNNIRPVYSLEPVDSLWNLDNARKAI